MDKDLKEKEVNLKKYETDLREREKAITDLILNNLEVCSNDFFMRSLSYNRLSTNGDDHCKNFDFEHFLG